MQKLHQLGRPQALDSDWSRDVTMMNAGQVRCSVLAMPALRQLLSLYVVRLAVACQGREVLALPARQALLCK